MSDKQEYEELVRKLENKTATMADFARLAFLEDILEAEAIAELD